MNIISIILLVGLAALAWICLKKPISKGAPARTWPASRGKTKAKPTLTKTF